MPLATFLVVCVLFTTIETCSPIISFIKLDFPTLVLPITVTNPDLNPIFYNPFKNVKPNTISTISVPIKAPNITSPTDLVSFIRFPVTNNERIRAKQKTNTFFVFSHIAVNIAKATADCPLGINLEVFFHVQDFDCYMIL